MTEKQLDFIDDYIRSKGYDPEKLDELSEDEYSTLLADGQIDAYLLGELEGGKCSTPQHKKSK